MLLQICNDYQEGRLYEYLFDELEKQGIEEEIFYFTAKEKTHLPQRENLMVSQAYHSWERVFYFSKQKKIYRDLKKHISGGKYALAHAHSLMTNGYMAYQLKKDSKLDYIVTVRSSDTEVFFRYKPYLLVMAKAILEDANHITFLSPAAQERCFRFFPKNREKWIKKTSIIPNGIDDIFFQEGQGENEKRKGLGLVFMATKIEDPNKNFKSVVELIRQLQIRNEDVYLTAIGQVEEKTRLKYKDYPINFTGKLDQKEIISVLRTNDIFIMPSYRESFGLVYVEAMSQGLPVIYTKGQGFDGQFDAGSVGYGVPATGIQEMVQAYDKIKINYEKMSRQAKKESRKFNWQKVAASYKKIYGGF